MIKGFGDEFGLYKQDNPLRHAFYVKAADPQKTAQLLRKLKRMIIHLKSSTVKEKLKNYSTR